MINWEERAARVLEELGAREQCVPGSRFRLVLAKPGTPEAEEFSIALRAKGQTFTEFARSLPNVVVHPQAGTDSFVGFTGARLPLPAGRRERDKLFREDVFEALTRASPTPYYYSPSTDRFGPTASSADAIELPRVTIDDLVQQRRQFADAIGEGLGAQLREALDYTANPLHAFSQRLTQLGLGHRWHEFRYADLREKLRAWAEKSGIEFSPSWLEPHAGALELGVHDVLAEIARFMTDEEIRGLAIPFRAVEAFFHARRRAPRT